MNASQAEPAKPGEKACLLALYSSSLVEDIKLVSILHKALTVALCVFYFSVIEQIPLTEVLVQNSSALAFIMGWAHVSSCFNLDFAPVYW